RLRSEWIYPKSPAAIALLLARRTLLLTGLWWIARGLLSSIRVREPAWMIALRYAFFVAAAAALTALGGWRGFLLYWVVPYCTWHMTIQYARLICEHSAVDSDDPAYRVTRSTLPGPAGRALVLPRHIGYHLAHHLYPSVPFYRLPA